MFGISSSLFCTKEQKNCRNASILDSSNAPLSFGQRKFETCVQHNSQSDSKTIIFTSTHLAGYSLEVQENQQKRTEMPALNKNNKDLLINQHRKRSVLDGHSRMTRAMELNYVFFLHPSIWERFVLGREVGREIPYRVLGGTQNNCLLLSPSSDHPSTNLCRKNKSDPFTQDYGQQYKQGTKGKGVCPTQCAKALKETTFVPKPNGAWKYPEVLPFAENLT